MSRIWPIAIMAFCLGAPALRAAEAPPEDRPYDVRLQIGFEASPQFDAAFRSAIPAQTAAGIERCLGQFWRATVLEEQGSVFSGHRALMRVTGDALLKNPALAGCDKAYLISISALGAGISALGREWDSATRQLGPPASRTILDRRELATELVALVHELFRPVAEIEASRTGPTMLRGRAGNLCPVDSTWQALPPGKFFEAFNCVLDKDLAVERIQQVPWTYLLSGDDAAAGRVSCVVTSGLRSPLSPRRHRLLTLALAINDRGTETKLTLVTRPPARKPLAGVEVELAASLPSAMKSNEADAPQQKLPLLITDRNGKVALQADLASAGRPIWLLVRSGQVLLARVPYLPGLHPAEVIELPDDSLRLEVEGDIALLQAQLVDTVARRAVLMAQIRARAKANEFDSADAAIRDLEAIPKAPRFTEDLRLIRVNRTNAARARRDKSTEERIRKLCAETAELVTNYLDETKVTELRDEVRELRRAVDDQARMEAKAKAAEERATKAPAPKSKPARQPPTKAELADPGEPAAEPAPDDDESKPKKKKKKAQTEKPGAEQPGGEKPAVPPPVGL